MKRSELLVSLEEMLIRSENFERGGAVELANEVLDFIEKAGMRCPIYWTEEEKEIVEFDPSGSYDGYTVKRNIAHYEWEPEDEEK